MLVFLANHFVFRSQITHISEVLAQIWRRFDKIYIISTFKRYQLQYLRNYYFGPCSITMKLFSGKEMNMPIPFMLFPDFTIVYQYLQLNDPLEVFQNSTNQEYYVYNNDYRSDSKVGRIENKFKAIVNNYGIEDHYDNALLIILENLNKMDNANEVLHNQLTQENRIKEISNFLLPYRRGNEFQLIVKEKINGKAETPAVVSDQVLLKWIASLVNNAFKNGVPSQLDLFGLLPSKLSLEAASQLKIKSIEPVLKKYQYRLVAELCIKLYHYLHNETSLKRKPCEKHNYLQLNFLHDTLILFSLIDDRHYPTEIKDYEPREYVRSIFDNYNKTYVKKRK